MSFEIHISPAVTGWNALTLPAAVGTNANAFGCRNCSEVAFSFRLIWAASINIQFKIFGTLEDNPIAGPSAASWSQLRSESIALGIGTLNPYSQIDTGAATRNFITKVNCAGLTMIQLRDIYGDGATNDALTIEASLVQER
jgi:hypothetical protein